MSFFIKAAAAVLVVSAMVSPATAQVVASAPVVTTTLTIAVVSGSAGSLAS